MCRKLIYLVSFVLVLSVVLSSVANAADLPGLVGWWKLDEMAGTTCFDSSVMGNDGHFGPEGDPQWVAGYFGGAVDLDGDNDYIEINSIADDITDDKFSIMAWIKTTQTNDGTVIGSNHSGSGHDVVFGVINGNLLVEADDLNEYPPKINDNQWHHIAYVRNGNTAYAYSDGVLVGTETPTKDPWTEPRWSIGQEWDSSPSDEYDGIVDDVHFFNRPLTAEEVELVMVGIPSGTSSEPSPEDEQIDVPRDVALSWKPGVYAPAVNGHTVYFSESFNDVNDGIGGVTQSAASYTPAQRLDFNKTYYWRVDEVNGPPDFTVHQGSVWSFTTELFAYPIENIIATASSQFSADQGPENTIDGSGLDENDLHSIEETGIWLSSMTGAQPTWIQYEFDGVYKLHQMWVWNHNTSMESVLGFGIKDATIDYSTDGASWTTLGTTHEFARAPGTDGYAPNTTVDLSGVVAKYVKITANSNWGGIINQYGLSEIRFLYTPVFAREPDPASGATDTDVEAVLSWRAGREAASHNVYFSTEQQAVIDETATVTTVTEASYGPLSLDLGQSYYWKVNEVNEAGTPAIWQGDVWNFSTQEYLVVDDIEDYNDFEPDRIFDTWIDGWADPTKGGSQVGSDVPPFAEKTIVHGGKQSMPLKYDNSTASYSEATANVANLPVGQDWTKYGITALSLWFHGDPTNAAEQMYVKLNGSKVTYDGAAANLTLIAWQQWNIELADFTGVDPAPVAGVGVNLSNVTELSIGLERIGLVGGSGVVYIDDIRLYRSAPAPVNEWRIAASSDDAEEYVLDGSMKSLTSTDLELGYEGAMAPAGLQTIGCRWVGVPVPKGATITEAWVQFSADSVGSSYHILDVSVIIEGELSANPATFSSTAGNISSRPTTTASVVWDIPRWMTTHAMGPEERTPDISPIIQEIVNQNGWAGNAIVLMFRDNPNKPSQGTREAESFNGTASEAPLLHITYQ